MIFQSLVTLYERLHAEEEAPPFGFSIEDIGFVITIDQEGNLIGQPEDLRTKINANTYGYFSSEVPYSNNVNVRSSGAAKVPNFLVDKADYLFGMSGSSEKKDHHRHFKWLVDEIGADCDDEGLRAVRNFLRKWPPKASLELEGWKDICGANGKWVAIRLKGDTGFIHDRPAVKKLWVDYVAKVNYPEGECFVTGHRGPIQPQFAQFKFGSGASLVSFNKNAYWSYKKERGANAPISVEAEFKSSTALKHLLRSKTQRIRIGDATTLFWTERETAVETFMGQILSPATDKADAVPVQQFLESVRAGKMPSEIESDKDVQFFILGLSLNKARLAIRFWHVCSVGDMMVRLQEHFNALKMERSSERDIEFPGIWHLIKETARETKDISPVLGGALIRSILTGGDYPQNLYQGVLGRIRAGRNIDYLKASILKAVLTRNQKKEVPMSLDPDRKDVAYLLGRLFAVLEKAQLDALGKINATIKDRFYGAASATPSLVFPRLIKLTQYHIEKAKYGRYWDNLIGELLDSLTEFPKHLSLVEQGEFAIGYYQQKIFRGSDKKERDNE
jgi:CRISPR-associated protein Csd1